MIRRLTDDGRAATLASGIALVAGAELPRRVKRDGHPPEPTFLGDVELGVVTTCHFGLGALFHEVGRQVLDDIVFVRLVHRLCSDP